LQIPGGLPLFLFSSDPANGATGVSVNTPLKFTVTAAVAADSQVTWSANVNAADIVYSQTVETFFNVLTCTPKSGWPVGVITWDVSSLKGTDGTPITMATTPLQGQFTTSSGSSTNNPCDTPGGSKTAGFFIFKQLRYTQDSVNPPVLEAESPASFLASLTSPVTNPVTQVTLKLPSGSTSNLFGFSGSFILVDSFDTQTDLDTAYPTGGYTLTASRQDGSTGSATVNLANNNYPPTPQINNFPAGQAIDPAVDFTLQWNEFTGATANDLLSLTISDQTSVVFQAPDPCVPRLLPDTATSVVIPGKTLQAGTTYDAILTYSRLGSRDNSIPGIPGTIGFSKTTSFKLRTTGGNPSGTPPKFTSFIRLPNGSFQVQLTGQPGVNYVIEGSTEVGGLAVWSPLTTTSSPTGVISFVDLQAVTLPQHFLRAHTIP
jgi:hypothetical protein